MYLVSGTWSTKAVKEAKKYCDAQETTDYKTFDGKGSYAPYIYACTNETVNGILFDPVELLGEDQVLVADMSSEILTREIDVSKYGLIFAGAQKNIGISGITIVIVREDLLGSCSKVCPVILDYTTNAKSKSLYNTPPTYPIYAAGLVFKWAVEQGGLKKLAALTTEKSDLIYNVLEKYPSVYKVLIEKPYRSRTNIVFRLVDEAQEAVFVAEAAKQNMVGLNGHRSVGGIRVSLYNATGVEAAKKLEAFIEQFATKK